MKQTIKWLFSLLLAATMLLTLSVTALAADSTITFKSLEEGFEFAPGSEYTATDLFDNFKDVMPGDKLTETIQVVNEATDCDYIKVYLKALIHDEDGNPLTYNEAFENADGKDQSDVEGQRDETVATMQDFLAQLTMRIYNGAELIYESSPDQAGAMADYVLLGTLFTGDALDLTVELDVPIDLSNEYADRVGEVDWLFLVEGFEYEKLTVHKAWDDNHYPGRPDSVTVHLLRDGQVHEAVELNEANQWTYTWDQLDEMFDWSVVEADVPDGYKATYSISDNTTWITNQRDYTPPSGPDPVDLTVRKVWSGDEQKLSLRPASIMVTLYNGTTEVDKVSLSANNNWTHTWRDLDGNGDWSVIETSVPKGYVPSYRGAGSVVTITNSATLIHTGQLNWPIAVLGVGGVLLLAVGVYMMTRKRKNGYA